MSARRAPPLRVVEVDASSWPDVERLFGPRGACGGCWCMYWRLDKGEKWDAVKGDPARGRFQALVEEGEAQGVLAFEGDEPVGWAALGRKAEFARLARSPSLRTDDADDVWALPCFYVKAGHRGQGVATALLEGALQAVRRRGGRLVEAYPVRAKECEPLPAAFAWTGTVPMFERAGFEAADEREKGKARMRKRLR